MVHLVQRLGVALLVAAALAAADVAAAGGSAPLSVKGAAYVTAPSGSGFLALGVIGTGPAPTQPFVSQPAEGWLGFAGRSTYRGEPALVWVSFFGPVRIYSSCQPEGPAVTVISDFAGRTVVTTADGETIVRDDVHVLFTLTPTRVFFRTSVVVPNPPPWFDETWWILGGEQVFGSLRYGGVALTCPTGG